MRFLFVLAAVVLGQVLPLSHAVAQESRPAVPAANADQKLVAETQLAAELWKRASDGCMRPILQGLLQRTQDRAELRERLAANCEPIVKAARDHLRAAGALAEESPSAHDMALGMADELIRDRVSAADSRKTAAPALSPGGVLTR